MKLELVKKAAAAAAVRVHIVDRPAAVADSAVAVADSAAAAAVKAVATAVAVVAAVGAAVAIAIAVDTTTTIGEQAKADSVSAAQTKGRHSNAGRPFAISPCNGLTQRGSVP
jgi:hypothetical protein